jgi:hypothetical protein
MPWWALTVRAILYPLDFFYWRMSRATGYQFETDTWIIEGVTWSASALRFLAHADGDIIRVTRIGQSVHVVVIVRTHKDNAEA